MFIRKRKYEWIMCQVWDKGVARGYQLGYHAGKIESSNRGYALSAQDAQQAIEEAERIVRGEVN